MTRGTQRFKFEGGENLVGWQPDQAIGSLIASYNYLPAVGGGYERVGGYESLDGRPAPHAQDYWTIPYESGGTTEPAVGDTITGDSSAATGIVCYVPIPDFGSWASGNAVGTLVMTQVTGTFQTGEILLISAVNVATTTAGAVQGDTSPALETRQIYLDAAADYARDQIVKPAGSGPVRGAFSFDGDKYAIRDNAGGTAAVLFKATTSGWTAVTLSSYVRFDAGAYIYKVSFTSGSVDPTVGSDFLVGEDGTSALIVGKSVTSGTFGGGDAVGFFLVKALEGGAGTFSTDEKYDIQSSRGTYAANDGELTTGLEDQEWIERGDTLKVNGSSTDTYTVGDWQLFSGSLSEGNAVGVITLSSTAGTAGANDDTLELTKESIDCEVAVQDGALVTPTLPAGGHYDIEIFNFYADPDRKAAYMANGVGYAIQFTKDEVFSFIFTGADESVGGIPGGTGTNKDIPSHVRAHNDVLALLFDTGSLQVSAVGLPLEWRGEQGAAEFALGDTGVGLARTTSLTATNETTSVLMVIGRNIVKALYGTDVDTFTLRTISPDSGGIEWSVQEVGHPRYADDRGLTDIKMQRFYGDINASVYSQLIDPLIRDKQDAETTVKASFAVKDFNQHWIFYSDQSVIVVLFDRRGSKNVVEFTRLFFPFEAFCAHSGEDATGREVLLVGDTDGNVYQMQVGRSFDGAEIEYAIRTPQHEYGRGVREVQFYNAVIDVRTESPVTLNVIAEYDRSEDRPSRERSKQLAGPSGLWNIDAWGTFEWAAPQFGRIYADIDGIGSDMGLIIGGQSKYDLPHTLMGGAVHYIPRGWVR